MAFRAPLCAALALLVSCTKDPEPPGAEEVAAQAPPPQRPVLELLDGQIVERQGLASRTAEDLLGLVRERGDPAAELTQEELAVLAEYDGMLERVMSGAGATGLVPDASKPLLITRDYELWVLPAGNDVCFTVEDRQGRVRAERIDEAALSRDFPYLHNLLHPEYLQFYDAVGD